MAITEEHRLYDRTRDECATAIDIINRELGREARERGWCSAFETFVERVNGMVGFTVLAPCSQVVNVSIDFEVPRNWSADGLHAAMRAAVLHHAGCYERQIGDISVRADVVDRDEPNPEPES